MILKVDLGDSIRVTNLNNETITYFQSIKSQPMKDRFNNRFNRVHAQWPTMNKTNRLNYHLSELADGKPFTYEASEMG